MDDSWFKIHDIDMFFSDLQEFRYVFLPNQVTPFKPRPFIFPGDDLSDVMTEHHTDCIFYFDLFHYPPFTFSFFQYCRIIYRLMQNRSGLSPSKDFSSMSRWKE